MILESKKIKSVTVSIVYPSICHEVMGTDAMMLVFLYPDWVLRKHLLSYLEINQKKQWLHSKTLPLQAIFRLLNLLLFHLNLLFSTPELCY